MFSLFSAPSFGGLDPFGAHKRPADIPLCWSEGVLQTDWFPAVIPRLLPSPKLSWHVLKKPAEEMLARFPLGRAPERGTEGQKFTPVESQSSSALVSLFFPAP